VADGSLIIILFFQRPDHGVDDVVVKTPFYNAFHPEAQFFGDVLTADIIRSTAYLEAGQSFYIKRCSYQGADRLRRIAFPDVVDADPVTYLPGIFSNAGMETSAADELLFLPVEDAKGVVETHIELTPEYADETDTGFQVPGFLLYPGQPGAKMIDAAGNGLMKGGGITWLVATEDESFCLYPVCFG